MNCIVMVNGRFLKRILPSDAPLVTSTLTEAVVMSQAQAATMAAHIKDEFKMETAVGQLRRSVKLGINWGSSL